MDECIDMLRMQIEARGIKNAEVLKAMGIVRRQEFVPEVSRSRAYKDNPLPIGEMQTISQPYIVALMSELLEVSVGDKVLEIGTGSGYQAAILAEMGVRVFSIEILKSLAESAGEILAKEGYQDVCLKWGDGHDGWSGEAPFDGIILTAAPSKLPAPLREQIKIGGRIVAPIGGRSQDLIVYRKIDDGVFDSKKVTGVRFVPMTGKIEDET